MKMENGQVIYIFGEQIKDAPDKDPLLQIFREGSKKICLVPVQAGAEVAAIFSAVEKARGENSESEGQAIIITHFPWGKREEKDYSNLLDYDLLSHFGKLRNKAVFAVTTGDMKPSKEDNEYLHSIYAVFGQTTLALSYSWKAKREYFYPEWAHRLANYALHPVEKRSCFWRPRKHDDTDWDLADVPEDVWKRWQLAEERQKTRERMRATIGKGLSPT